jgi:hypothetical protein
VILRVFNSEQLNNAFVGYPVREIKYNPLDNPTRMVRVDLLLL